MNSGSFIWIRSTKFPILPGEDGELVNPGMYGKALCQYLQPRLVERGHRVPSFCCEDWGWWIQLEGAPFTMGIGIYCDERSGAENPPCEFVCCAGMTEPRKWSWRKLRFLDTAPWTKPLAADLLAIFESDPDIELVSVTEDFPSPW